VSQKFEENMSIDSDQTNKNPFSPSFFQTSSILRPEIEREKHVSMSLSPCFFYFFLHDKEERRVMQFSFSFERHDDDNNIRLHVTSVQGLCDKK